MQQQIGDIVKNLKLQVLHGGEGFDNIPVNRG